MPHVLRFVSVEMSMFDLDLEHSSSHIFIAKDSEDFLQNRIA